MLGVLFGKNVVGFETQQFKSCISDRFDFGEVSKEDIMGLHSFRKVVPFVNYDVFGVTDKLNYALCGVCCYTKFWDYVNIDYIFVRRDMRKSSIFAPSSITSPLGYRKYRIGLSDILLCDVVRQFNMSVAVGIPKNSVPLFLAHGFKWSDERTYTGKK